MHVLHGMTYQDLNSLCRKLGAPEFQSNQEMIDWLCARFTEAGSFVALNSVLPVWELVRGIGSAELRYLDRLLSKLVRKLLRLKLQLYYRFQIKALLSPLRMIPKSLHPIDAVA
jgi:hypothetical protein